MPINKFNLHEISKVVSEFKNSKLCIVTKNRSEVDVLSLVSSGFRLFGENRVQEAQKKFLNITDKNGEINLHLIGPLQSNKAELALKLFHTIQTLDRFKLVDAIYKIIQKSKPKTSNFYIQVNIGNEAQKSGVKPQDLKKLYEYSLEKNLKVAGLMCIPPVDKDPTLYFKDMVSLRDITNPNLLLSMGMSADYLPALQNGSNLIRVGSKIFQ
mgnify:CR=1 FL=1